MLPLEKQSAERFLRDVLRPKDEAFVVTFDVQVKLAQDFTDNLTLLDDALNSAQINTAGGGGSVGIPGGARDGADGGNAQGYRAV